MLTHDRSNADYRIPDSVLLNDQPFWGGWSHKKVWMVIFCYFANNGNALIRFFVWQTYSTRSGTAITIMLRCPLRYRCGCMVECRILDIPKFWILQRCGEHRKTSHMVDKSIYLKVAQKDVIRDAVRLQPLTTGTSVRRNLKNMSPQTQVSPQSKESVKR